MTFRVPPRGEDIRGFVVAMDLTEIDGIDTSELDEPVHTVSSDGGLWAIHPSWVIS